MMTIGMSMAGTREPVAWWECDWTPGRGRRFGHTPHVLYADAPIIGSPTAGPVEVEACLNVHRAAERVRFRLQRARIDFVLSRFRYYRDVYSGQFTTTQYHVAVARDTGLTVYEVAQVLSETHAYAA